MHHKGTKATEEDINKLSHAVLGAALEVHKTLGPGLLESAYEEGLAHELCQRQLRFERQAHLPLSYKGLRLDCAYRLDFLVQGLVVVELKSVDQILEIHKAQLLTYLRLSGRWLGLLLNFNVPVLRQGIFRIVNGSPL